jgi:hypothetical protein
MKKIKPITVNDFIIFLKTKIAIILFSTFLLSAITSFYQVSYEDHWEVKVSRTVDNSSLVETIILIKNQAVINSKKFDEPTSVVDPMTLMGGLNDLINSSMINYLSNADIKYTGIKKPKNNVNLLRKEVYNLIIAGSDTKNKSIIKYNLSRFIADTNRLTREILKLQYGLDPTYNLDIYDFKIIETLRVEGFNYSQILKIIFINLVVSIFGIFIFHIRKSINLF